MKVGVGSSKAEWVEKVSECEMGFHSSCTWADPCSKYPMGDSSKPESGEWSKTAS